MKPKTLAILYWVFTIIFAGLMIFSAVSGINPTPDFIKIAHDFLGYPVYFIPLLSIAKLVGSIAILIPSFDRIKEWAYAGLFFDLIFVVYSGIAASHGFDPRMFGMLVWIIPGILSYYFWVKRGR
jgi:uncharacterized membrane protein YphA (DoxX/SURF4 family)